VVAVNTRFRSVEVADILARSGAKVLVYWPGFRGIDFEGILHEAGADALSGLAAIVAYDEEAAPREQRTVLGHKVRAFRDLASCPPYSRDHARPDLGCLIFTTSGTTRLPKFVLHSQSAIASHAAEAARGFAFDAPGARALLTVPMCGTFGMSNALMPFAMGRPLVMIPTFDAQQAMRAIRTHQVTHVPASGDIVAQLLNAAREPIPYPSVRMVLGVRSGQAAPAQSRGLTLVGIYGSSEMQAVLSRQPLFAPPAQREIGGGKLVNAATQVRACDVETGRVLPHGEQGELQFKGSSCMIGYYGNPEATAAAFTRDGYFRSGDLGYTVADGEYVYLSRMGDVLRLAGFLVNPMEIEAVLDAHPAVGQSQVVGIDGPRGPMPVAFVVPKHRSGVDEAALLEYCARQIAQFKVPRHVLTLDEFPITPSANGNKIQKAKLREMAAAALHEK
jgi:fatty-acyl-CoA synthase